MRSAVRSPALPVVFVMVLMIALPAVAHADKVDTLIGQLRRSKDYKVRLSAALNLAKLRDERAISAFIGALDDSDKTVRGVAAASIGKLVDSSTQAAIRTKAIARVKRASESDRNAFVRKQAAKAVQALEAISNRGSAAASGSVYIDIGPMTAQVSEATKMREIMKKSAHRVFKDKASAMMTTWPGGRSPTGKQLKSKNVTGFYIDGTLNTLDVKGSGSSTVVACKIRLVVATYPAKSMFAFANGGAKVTCGSSARDIAFAKEDCVAAVVESLIGKQIIPTIETKSRAR